MLKQQLQHVQNQSATAAQVKQRQESPVAVQDSKSTPPAVSNGEHSVLNKQAPPTTKPKTTVVAKRVQIEEPKGVASASAPPLPPPIPPPSLMNGLPSPPQGFSNDAVTKTAGYF